MRYGHFDNEHREYVIERVDLPTSWTNYLGVENLAVVVNHTAGGYSFYKSPEYHRITRFHGNSIPMDRPGYYVYIRDNEKKEDGTNDYFSISWQPVAKDLEKAKYRCRHGMSYTAYECEYDHIKASDLWDVLPEVLTNGATINGSDGYGVYAVPGYKDIATQNCWDVNMTRMRDLGYTDADVEHLDYYSDEFEEMLAKAKEAGGSDLY